MMEKYFDVHVYVSNWGCYHFMLRFPRGVIAEETTKQWGGAAGSPGTGLLDTQLRGGAGGGASRQRTVGELRASVRDAREERERQEDLKRERKRIERERKRREYLKEMATRSASGSDLDIGRWVLSGTSSAPLAAVSTPSRCQGLTPLPLRSERIATQTERC